MAKKAATPIQILFTSAMIAFLHETIDALPTGDSATAPAPESDGLDDLDRDALKALIMEEEVELAVKKATTEDEMRDAIREHRASQPPGAEALNGESDAAADGLDDLDRDALKALIMEEEVELAVKKATTEDEMRDAIRAKRAEGDTTSTDEEEASGPSIDTVREALKKLVIKDKEQAKKLLAKYKAKSLPELDAKHYDAVITEALKLAK